jgi:oligoendopeptidase F
LTILFTRQWIAIALVCATLQISSFGQDSFVAIQPQRAEQYHINFARNFFPNAEAEKAARANLHAAIKTLEDLKGRVAASADNLQRALELNDHIQIETNRHYSYLYLRYAVDTRDSASLADSSNLVAEVNRRTAFLSDELMQIDDRKLTAFVSEKPALKQYLFAIEAIRRNRPHTLSLTEEELLSAIAPDNAWEDEFYERLRARIPVLSNDGSDSKAREEAFKARWAALATQRDLFAFALTRLAAQRTRLAELRHFQDAASQVYFNSYWTRAEVDTLLEQLAQKADLYKRYQRMRADYAANLAGSITTNIWDSSVRPSGFSPPRFTIDETTRVIREALAPLGVEYGKELNVLLDPANGRMDIVPGPNRLSGGFSRGFIGTDSVFFSHGFTGTYNDVRVLTHESTHAVHRQLMTGNHVSPSYASGPNYLFESFAIFNEFLLPDYLYTHETDPQRKRFYLEQFLEGKGTIMFVVAPEVAVEHAVYDGVKQDTIKGPDDLDAITKRIYSRYSIWPERHDELKGQWMNIPLMYEDPFYDANYIYGALLALKFYQTYTRDRQHFVPRYIALMRAGFDAPPAVLLKRFLDIDLIDPHLLSDALSVVEAKIDLLQEPSLAIEETLSVIREDLSALKSTFPQLATIDQSTIKNGVLRYVKGFLRDDKIEGAVFEKNGCDVYVEIKYPATRSDVEMRQLAGSLFRVKNGKSFAVWRAVRAENNEQGIGFSNKVNEIISLRLAELEKELN